MANGAIQNTFREERGNLQTPDWIKYTGSWEPDAVKCQVTAAVTASLPKFRLAIITCCALLKTIFHPEQGDGPVVSGGSFGEGLAVKIVIKGPFQVEIGEDLPLHV